MDWAEYCEREGQGKSHGSDPEEQEHLSDKGSPMDGGEVFMSVKMIDNDGDGQAPKPSTWIQIPAQPVTGCMSLGNLLNLFQLQSALLLNRIKFITVVRMLPSTQ